MTKNNVHCNCGVSGENRVQGGTFGLLNKVQLAKRLFWAADLILRHEETNIFQCWVDNGEDSQEKLNLKSK